MAKIDKCYEDGNVINQVHNGNTNPAQKSYFRQFFEKLIMVFNWIIPFHYGASGPSKMIQDEGFTEIHIGKEMVKELDEKFSDSTFGFPFHFDMVVEIPISLGKQLHAACIESVLRQEEEYNKVISDLRKEHTEFRNKLLALNKKSGESSFEDWDINTDVEDVDTEFDTIDAVPTSVNLHREQARKHLKEQKIFFKKAQQCLNANRHREAQEYFVKANQQLRFAERANNDACDILQKQCFKGVNCIDLHGFFVREAIQVLDNFLDESIIDLEKNFFDKKSVMVITGRGKHSSDGIPKIKIAVCGRLKQRCLKYSETNPGLLKVNVKSDSYLTEDLEYTYY